MQDVPGASALHGAQYTKKRVVIVDDSQTLRHWLRVVLEQDPRLEVVGEADCAAQAREVIKQTHPDVITLDIEMPGMSGLAFLEKLMQLRPLPVVMISGTTRSNSEATITALSLGAVDCILKPTAQAGAEICRDIARRVFSAACSTVQQIIRGPRTLSPPPSGAGRGTQPLILMGASTGGVAALERVLADLAPDAPPVVIVQHMPGAFLVSFSKLLNSHLPQNVAIAQEHEVLQPGQVRLAPGLDHHTHVVRQNRQWRCTFVKEPRDALHRPSVDSLFLSARAHAEDVIAVILTGLGRDGAEGMKALAQAGAVTFGQDAETSVVYGMPRAAFENGGVRHQLPLYEIGAAVNRAAASHGAVAGGLPR